MNRFQEQKENLVWDVCSISDSLGIVIAGCINWWLELKLCHLQVARGRDWCLKGGHYKDIAEFNFNILWLCVFLCLNAEKEAKT